MDNIEAGGKQFVHCREVVHSLECRLSEVPLYMHASSIKTECVSINIGVIAIEEHSRNTPDRHCLKCLYPSSSNCD